MRLIKLTFVKLANSIDFLKINVAASDFNWILFGFYQKAQKEKICWLKQNFTYFACFSRE